MSPHHPRRLRGAVPGALGLVALAAVTAGCGGGKHASPAPTPTRGSLEKTSFCATFRSVPRALDSPETAVAVQGAHQFAVMLTKQGLPAGLPANTVQGFKLYVHELASVDAAHIRALRSAADPSDVFGEGAAGDVASFTSYVRDHCTTLTAQPTASEGPGSGDDDN